MNRDRITVLAALGLAAVCWGLAGRLLPDINAQRQELQLTVNPDVFQNLPPALALTQAAPGSFRGLAIDYLWIRAAELQETGQYHEALQLASWITRLQPRFTQVWAFQAWNMAYNISEATRTPEERWMWVQNAIALLRDQGLPQNPRSVMLYQQLAYLFYHRIGKYSADMHWYFKRAHAREWQRVLGTPTEGSTEEALAALRQISAAPAGYAAFEEANPGVRAQVQALKDHGFGLDDGLLAAFFDLESRGGRPLPDGPNKAALEWLDAWRRDPQAAAAREALVAFTRAQVLRDKYHMDPQFMYELEAAYGPLDWRHPAAHALYWAALGAKVSAQQKQVDLWDVLQADRIALHSLQSLAQGGRVFYDPETGYYNEIPEPRLFDAFEKASREAGVRQKGTAEVPWQFADVHRGFLTWATVQCKLYGSREQAAKYYAMLRDEYGARPEFSGHYVLPLGDFVRQEMVRNLQRIEEVRPVLNALILEAILQGYMLGKSEAARSSLAAAGDIYAEFAKHYPLQRPFLDQQQTGLPPLVELEADALGQFLLFPPSWAPWRYKRRAWQDVPLEWRQHVFDRVRGPLYDLATRAKLDPSQEFPEPPGMEDFRRSRPAPPRERGGTGPP